MEVGYKKIVIITAVFVQLVVFVYAPDMVPIL